MLLSSHYPWIEFIISIGTWTFDGAAYIDTGFEGGLLIPVSISREIVAQGDRGRLQVGDGAVVPAMSWTGVLELNGSTFTCDVSALGSRFLLGREVIDRVEVCFEFGERLRIRFRDEV